MQFDDEYFFIRKNDSNPRLPSLQPDTSTAERHYWYQPQPRGSSPLVFINAWRSEFKEQGMEEELADILFEGVNFIVREPIRRALLKLEVPSLHMHPAVYIDDKDTPHEDYWYVAFSDMFDCWDRDKSTYLPEPVDIGGKRMYEMLTYSLNADLLGRTLLQNRLLFQIDQTTTDMIVCHRSVAEIFRQDGRSGARLQCIKDY